MFSNFFIFYSMTRMNVKKKLTWLKVYETLLECLTC